ncbi:S26 family signal peptidase, partial [bacterium]|nr:S26 family signal peptidase [bacterium]
GPLYLKEDEYFMMGDNRGNSQDSRYWGPLKESRFIGKASFIFRLNKLK